MYICGNINGKNMNNTITNTMTTFEAGSVYEMRFIGDSNLKPLFICTKRTAKSVTFERFKGTETFTKRVKISDDAEYVLYDTYSMAPIIRSTRIVL